ncbi:MAG: lipopolysaccharide biosynthesis protein [Paracoccaceae bacterium]
MAAKLANTALVYMSANIANAAVPFVLLPILTRVLTPEDYGVVAMYAVMLGIFGALTGLSVHGAIAVRYFQLTESEMADFCTACVIIVGASTLAVVALVALAAPQLTGLTGLPMQWLVAGVLVSAAQILSQIRLSLWQVRGQAMRFGAFQVGQTLSNALLSLFFVVGLGLSWDGRLGGQSLAVGAFGVAALILLYAAGFLVRPVALRRHVTDALRFGVPLVPHVLGGLMFVALDRFIIAGQLGLASAGIYMVAAQIGQVLGLLTDAFNKAYAPWLMGQLSSPETVNRPRIVRGTYVYFVVVLVIALTMGAVAPLIVSLMAGEAFQAASSVVVYVAVGYAFSGCYLMVTNYIFYESKTGFLACITFGAGLVHAPLTYVLVSQNGIAGAGQAFAISQFLAFLATWWLANRAHPMPWRKAVLA